MYSLNIHLRTKFNQLRKYFKSTIVKVINIENKLHNTQFVTDKKKHILTKCANFSLSIEITLSKLNVMVSNYI